MAVSAYIVWRNGFKKKSVKNALKIFAIQLILNLSWSPVFFGSKNILLALFIILAMIVFIVKTIKAFAKVSIPASYLLYPYLLWVGFATILNLAIWLLNK